jgi:hypothetical protein
MIDNPSGNVEVSFWYTAKRFPSAKGVWEAPDDGWDI